jgi:3-oxoacyl-[acyl-carrier protein] reductase
MNRLWTPLRQGACVDRLRDKVALVTGSSRGIGAAIASCFAQEGAKVALHGRDMAALCEVRAEIAWAGGRASHFVAETTKFDDIEDMRRQIERELGSIDILVANAGGNVAKPGPVEDISEADWRAAVDGNLTATFLTVKSVLPGMKTRRSGTIITISSAAARRPHPGSPVAYAAAKAGIEIFTQDLAVQAGPYGIRANCIAPETILTERNKERIPQALQTAMCEQHPIRRLGTPDDVARAALYLASEDASWVAGVVVDVAGGAVMV